MADATIIQASSLTKNANKQRDPDMRQTKKGQQWCIGMEAHIGVDVESGLVHTVTTTPANAGDVTEVDKLLHGQEQMAYAESRYQDAEKPAPRRGRSCEALPSRRSVDDARSADLGHASGGWI
jgi:IS5 family transposase